MADLGGRRGNDFDDEHSCYSKLLFALAIFVLTGHAVVLTFGATVVQDSDYVWFIVTALVVMDVLYIAKARKSTNTTEDQQDNEDPPNRNSKQSWW